MKHFLPVFCLLFLAFALPAQAAERFLDIKEVTSDKGLSAWLVEDHTLPVIAVKFAFTGAGSINDPEDKQGLAQLLSNTLDEGAGDYDSQAFQKALTDHSISLRFGAGRDDFTGSLKTLTRHKDLAFDLLTQALTAPRFDPDAVERMRQSNLTRIRSSLSDPDWITARIMNDIAFAEHPYAMNSGGTLTTLLAITPDDLRAFAKDQLTRERLKIAVTGDITADELKAVLDHVFGALPAVKRETVDLSAEVQNAGVIALYKKDIPQTIIQISQPGIGHDDPDYFPAKIMDFILGGSGFGSRLTEEIREKRGLTYGIHTGFYELDYLKAYTAQTSTKNETAGEMLTLIKAEWQKMKDQPVSAEELAAAQSYLVGSMPLSLSSTDRIAGMMLSLQTDHLPIDYLDHYAERVEGVTIEDIARVSKRLLTPDALTIVMVGQPEGITPTKTIETLPNVE